MMQSSYVTFLGPQILRGLPEMWLFSVWHSASYIINDHFIQVSYFSPGAIVAGIETAYSPPSQ